MDVLSLGGGCGPLCHLLEAVLVYPWREVPLASPTLPFWASLKPF